MRDICPIADKRQLPSIERAEPLLQSLHVRQRLARMVQIAQRINHWNFRPLCQLLDGRVREYPRHNSVRPPIQIARDVFHRLALRNRPDARDRIAAQLLDGKLKRQPRPQRRLFE
jgi:hypothetical protein